MFNPLFLKLSKSPVLLALITIALYSLFAYDLVRTDYTKLILLYTALFGVFYTLVKNHATNFKLLVGFAILFRLVFLFATPNLSQDFYRFIWDGRMILEGFNPYLFTPESFISVGNFPVAQAQELYNGMGLLNASHFTNYPPVKQFIFMIAALFSGKSILGSAMVFRVFIIAADIGALYFGKKLLERLKMPVHNIFWYILNPFIIIELTGSLHFEGIMICFLVLSLYLLHLGKWKTAAVIFALSVSVKLIPLLFLPLFFQYFVKNKDVINLEDASSQNTTKLGFIKLVGFYAIIGITTLVLFAPFYSSEFIHNYAETVGLWFSRFEFNASFYYIAREIGHMITGYNQIAVIGKFIPILTIVMLLLFTFLRKNITMQQVITSMLLAASIYFFMSTTIHPWYLATLLILSVFTNFKFPLVWSFMIILSYLAYANSDNTENLWIIALEYSVVFAVFFWELFKKKDRQIAVF
ncbi:polyprenol phosphomannose-dependent alpha 1,6 mannosyltransferase MptB [uncultured Gelidibacter sp.]|uniref:polyprenol phosphomannose-dependent alpha 1,6 mannosyltransferase MptB n=1 Tax=uncultured Gelidibacter sp. TaxID=259318 RepID=UPI002624FB22|nr:polyprenol phosphomannose-dependent alpha 1,6 mannosyltransferase MptB [uncultured Gelidibacter sp.]